MSVTSPLEIIWLESGLERVQGGCRAYRCWNVVPTSRSATEKARSSKQVFYFQTFTLPLISDCRRAPALHVAEWMQLHKPTCMYIDVDFEGKPGVTGPIISPAGLSPGILWPRPIYTLGYIMA